ncbi:NADP-specific glutamate dehydrogenase [Lacticigenium naphthae]|uniref:NADP-specific glutamate dehydrogenase n=1 Tax=Lacticigenium naphthae TaxID=515351 RepID=UPI00040CDB20|nr:NADP-specific glutamate dehydrogenase [Lacticigenium naphthae]
MNAANDYINRIMKQIQRKHANQDEFLQAVEELFYSLENVLDKNPHYIKENILERLSEPDRMISFKVTWKDDTGFIHVNRGYRVQFNSVIGPYKGGLRFHPSVNESVIKFLGFEQILKNALTGLPLGGGKGGSDFDPKGKSDGEILRFCESYMIELQKYIGSSKDIPAGDIGVGEKEIGYLYGAYKKINGNDPGTITGKPIALGGSLGRKEATGYGLVYFMEKLLEDNQQSLDNKRIVVSGAGNVAIYAMEKAIEKGAHVIACSDSKGFLYTEKGIDLNTIKNIKEDSNHSLEEYCKFHSDVRYVKGSVWNLQENYEIALPCATQNEINKEKAKIMLTNGVKYVGEGANMPLTKEALTHFQEKKVSVSPAKAANAGGVTVSAFEMSQNSQRTQWTKSEVDTKLKQVMHSIYEQTSNAAKTYGEAGNLVYGANVAGFIKVADAMILEGKN